LLQVVKALMKKIFSELLNFLFNWSLYLAKFRKNLRSLFGIADISFVTPLLAIGSKPTLRVLKSKNIKKILDLRKEEWNDIKSLNDQGITYFKLPMDDDKAPSYEALSRAVNIISSSTLKGERIMVFCSLGRTRSPMVAIAYLISRGIPPNVALSKVKNARKFIHISSEQMEVLNHLWQVYMQSGH